MSETENLPRVKVFGGVEERRISKLPYSRMFSHPGVQVQMESSRWRDRDESIRSKRERVKEAIKDADAIIAISGSGRFIPHVVDSLDPEDRAKIRAVVTVASPLDLTGWEKLPPTIEAKRSGAPHFVEFMEGALRGDVPAISEETIEKMLSVFGTEDAAVSPRLSQLPGVVHHKLSRPPGIFSKLSHIYNIYEASQSEEMWHFLIDRVTNKK